MKVIGFWLRLWDPMGSGWVLVYDLDSCSRVLLNLSSGPRVLVIGFPKP